MPHFLRTIQQRQGFSIGNFKKKYRAELIKNKKFIVLHVIEKLNDEEGGLYNIVENLCRFLPTVKSLVLTDKIKSISS